ncbi:MAG: heme ABC transporter permease CcmC [Gammaproteobacteria bacterium]|jgi:heme exporter protein C|nr:MAG: heme exporter protein C [Gammaproteobacteria bacterium]|tara:strand:+ start:2774 stop:3505 length:732 start_codon:yes stop_codon:yes gene_type:complete
MYKYIAKYLLLPKVFRFFGVVVLPSLFIGLVGFFICSYLALFVLPADATQQEIYRILFVHVPAAIFSELIYIFMACCGFIYLVWKTKISAIMLRSAISLGLVFTLIVLISGAIWGKPTWGTYWVWDARITSTFILLIQYIGLLALRTSFNTMQTTDQILSIVAIVGAINIPIIKFSVNWWNTLHQNASITFSGSSIDAEMLYVLPLMLISFGFIAFSIFGRNIQSEIIIRQGSSKKIGELING